MTHAYASDSWVAHHDMLLCFTVFLASFQGQTGRPLSFLSFVKADGYLYKYISKKIRLHPAPRECHIMSHPSRAPRAPGIVGIVRIISVIPGVLIESPEIPEINSFRISPRPCAIALSLPPLLLPPPPLPTL